MKGIARSSRWAKPALAVMGVAGLLGGAGLLATARAEKEQDAPPPTAAVPGKASPADLEAGKAIYFRKCVWCHGSEGAGDGPGADRLWPRPRNFNQGTFKDGHTGSGGS